VGSENIHRNVKELKECFEFYFLELYHKDWVEFRNDTVRVRGDENWISFVNVESKEQSKQWVYAHTPNKQEKFTQTLLVCQNTDGNLLQATKATA
jgi:hypothetical protein